MIELELNCRDCSDLIISAVRSHSPIRNLFLRVRTESVSESLKNINVYAIYISSFAFSTWFSFQREISLRSTGCS